MKKMLRGKNRKNKSLAAAVVKAKLKEVVFTKEGRNDPQIAQTLS